MSHQNGWLLGLAMGLAMGLQACGGSEEQVVAPGLEEPAPGGAGPAEVVLEEEIAVAEVEPAPGRPPGTGALDPEQLSGVYTVEGVTVQADHGQLRKISGTVYLAAEGETYRTRVELDTTFPGEGEAPARVRGTGKGMIVGEQLAGVMENQMWRQGAEALVATPLTVFSSTVATFEPDGRLRIQIQNDPAPGQDYSPSITVLRGRRTGPLPAGELPPVGARTGVTHPTVY